MANEFNTPYLHTTWCDDVRHELGNKTSLIGVFATDIILPGLPTVLAKLVSHNTLMLPVALRPRQLQFKLHLDDTVLLDQTIALDELPRQGVNAGGEPATRRMMNMVMVLSPLELPAGARKLFTSVALDDQVLQGNTLWITLAPAAPEASAELAPTTKAPAAKAARAKAAKAP